MQSLGLYPRRADEVQISVLGKRFKNGMLMYGIQLGNQKQQEYQEYRRIASKTPVREEP